MRGPHNPPALDALRLVSDETARPAEESIYVQIEACRIRGEQLAVTGLRSRALDEVQRQLGLAGYHASTWIDPPTRHEGEARAREHVGPPRADPLEMLEALADDIDRSLDAVDACLETAGAGDHLRRTLAHLMSARRSLGDDTWGP